jgi:hypothetical protein
MTSDARTPRVGIGRALVLVAVMLGYAIAAGLLAIWLDRSVVLVLPALVIGGCVIGGLLGRMLFRSPARKEEPSAPATGPERPRD